MNLNVCAQWLRNYATSQKAAVSIPDEVIRLIIDLFLPVTLSLETHPLTEMSTRRLPGGKSHLVIKAYINSSVSLLSRNI
jgi:hypothetical protein